MLAVLIVLFVLASITADAIDAIVIWLRDSFFSHWYRSPRSLRILLAWIVASVLLLFAMHAAYAAGVNDGVALVRARAHASRAALDGRHFIWPRGAMLEARRIHPIYAERA